MEQTYTNQTWFFTCTFRREITAEKATASWQEYMKALRKLTKKSTIRYFCVQELGTKNSRLHLHALVFSSELITGKDLQRKWKAGFSNVKLLTSKHISYVTKYVTKGKTSRILASQKLGYFLPPRTPDTHTHPMWYLKKYKTYKSNYQI